MYSGIVQPDGDTQVWRYLDTAKFLPLLVTGELYFSRVDILEDQFEGSLSRITANRYKSLGRNLPHADNERLRKFAFVNCWHASPHESAAMWKLYSRNFEGVAIRSTIHRIIKSIRQTSEAELRRKAFGLSCQGLTVGRIHYIDYLNGHIPTNPEFDRFFYKRKSFEYEKEVRLLLALFDDDNICSQVDFSREDGPIGAGIGLPVDLNTLIDKIYLHPEVPGWFHDSIEAIAKKYGLEQEIVKSNLASDPIL